MGSTKFGKLGKKKMLRRVIYTLYLFSKGRKTGDDFLMSGGSTFFLIFINLITILNVGFSLMKKSFIAFFVEYEYILLGITLTCFFYHKFMPGIQ